jgi:hypothetical protein
MAAGSTGRRNTGVNLSAGFQIARSRVADGGPDHPASVGAVCPTCHRLIHHGQEGNLLNADLQKHVAELERGLDGEP